MYLINWPKIRSVGKPCCWLMENPCGCWSNPCGKVPMENPCGCWSNPCGKVPMENPCGCWSNQKLARLSVRTRVKSLSKAQSYIEIGVEEREVSTVQARYTREALYEMCTREIGKYCTREVHNREVHKRGTVQFSKERGKQWAREVWWPTRAAREAEERGKYCAREVQKRGTVQEVYKRYGGWLGQPEREKREVCHSKKSSVGPAGGHWVGWYS